MLSPELSQLFPTGLQSLTFIEDLDGTIVILWQMFTHAKIFVAGKVKREIETNFLLY